MAMTERARAELYDRLDQTLGRDAADTLMGYLPPVGWADVTTKQDLASMEVRLEARIGRLEARIDRLDAGVGGRIADVEIRFERALRQAVLALVTTMIASVGAAVAITQLLTG